MTGLHPKPYLDDPMAPEETDAPAAVRGDAWIRSAFEAHERCREEMAEQLSAVREANAVGATALIEMRSAVQDQLESLRRSIARLEQDLAGTKNELAEVVIESSSIKEEMTQEVADYINNEILSTRSHFNEMQQTLRETLQAQVKESKTDLLQATEKQLSSISEVVEANRLKTLTLLEQEQTARDTVASQLEAQFRQRLEAGFDAIDAAMNKVMYDSGGGVVARIDDLKKEHSALEEWTRQEAEKLRKMCEECAGYSRKFQELHERLEPRVFNIEATQRQGEARAERTQNQIQSLVALSNASRFSSPADDPRDSGPASVNEEPTAFSRAATLPATPTSAQTAAAADKDDAWRHPGPKESRTCLKTPQSAVETVVDGRRQSLDSGVVRDGPSRAVVQQVTTTQPQQQPQKQQTPPPKSQIPPQTQPQPQQQAYRTVPSTQRLSPPRAGPVFFPQ